MKTYPHNPHRIRLWYYNSMSIIRALLGSIHVHVSNGYFHRDIHVYPYPRQSLVRRLTFLLLFSIPTTAAQFVGKVPPPGVFPPGGGGHPGTNFSDSKFRKWHSLSTCSFDIESVSSTYFDIETVLTGWCFLWKIQTMRHFVQKSSFIYLFICTCCHIHFAEHWIRSHTSSHTLHTSLSQKRSQLEQI